MKLPRLNRFAIGQNPILTEMRAATTNFHKIPIDMKIVVASIAPYRKTLADPALFQVRSPDGALHHPQYRSILHRPLYQQKELFH